MQPRRAHLGSLLGMAALAGAPFAARAEDQPIPPEGIGHRIKHLSYSDSGGDPARPPGRSKRDTHPVARPVHARGAILGPPRPRRPKPHNGFPACAPQPSRKPPGGSSFRNGGARAVLARTANRRPRKTATAMRWIT